jgi:hypothetical protein
MPYSKMPHSKWLTGAAVALSLGAGCALVSSPASAQIAYSAYDAPFAPFYAGYDYPPAPYASPYGYPSGPVAAGVDVLADAVDTGVTLATAPFEAADDYGYPAYGAYPSTYGYEYDRGYPGYYARWQPYRAYGAPWSFYAEYNQKPSVQQKVRKAHHMNHPMAHHRMSYRSHQHRMVHMLKKNSLAHKVREAHHL